MIDRFEVELLVGRPNVARGHHIIFIHHTRATLNDNPAGGHLLLLLLPRRLLHVFHRKLMVFGQSKPGSPVALPVLLTLLNHVKLLVHLWMTYHMRVLQLSLSYHTLAPVLLPVVHRNVALDSRRPDLLSPIRLALVNVVAQEFALVLS